MSEKKGEYKTEVRKRDRKRIVYYGKRWFPIPSDQTIITRYHADMEHNGVCSSTLNTWFGFVGAFYTGKRSVREGKKHYGLPLTKRISTEQIKAAIRSFWPESLVRDFMSGKDVNLGNLGNFKKAHKSEYVSAHDTRKHHNGEKVKMGLRKIMDSVYPGFYSRLRKQVLHADINLDKLRDILIERHEQGLPISKSYLLKSSDEHERRLGNTIMLVADKPQGLLKRKSTYNRVVTKLTGINKHDFSLTSGTKRKIAHITEKLASFVFSWQDLLGINYPGCPTGRIHYGDSENAILYEGEKGIADIRVGNSAVEVKMGRANFNTDRKEKLQRKYMQGNKWFTGEKLDSSLVLFFQPVSTYNDIVHELNNCGINVMSQETFHSLLIQIVNRIKNQYSNLVEELKPRIHNLDYLASLSDSGVLTLLARPGNEHRRDYTRDVLESLVQKAQEIKYDT